MFMLQGVKLLPILLLIGVNVSFCSGGSSACDQLRESQNNWESIC